VLALTLVNWLAQVFVICVGVCAAVALTGDPLVELHESTQTGFRSVQFIRFGIVTASAVVGAAVMFTPIHLLGTWPRDEGWITLVSPAGAAIFVTMVALAAATFTGTVSATTIAVVAGWVFLALLWDPYVVPLPAQRGLPLIAALVLVAVAWRRLGDSESNITKVASI